MIRRQGHKGDVMLIIGVSLLFLLGFIKSFAYSMHFVLLFAELFVFSYVYLYLIFKARNGTGLPHKIGWIRFIFRMFFIAVTVFLIISVLFHYQPLGEVLDPYYFILLLVFLAEVFISHLVGTIQLKKEQTQAELLLLRSQLNPHFFFNTLNNLYALTLKKSNEAPEVILKLSDMMRYTIYEGEKNAVPIQDEISYLNNYLDLYRIRYKNPVRLEFNHDIEQELTIAPLLFINLLENAFKHGVDAVTDNAFIRMNLNYDGHLLHFVIENSFDPSITGDGKGIGLENLKRRLALLYPNKHSLVFEQEDTTFRSTLKIAL